MSPTDLDKRTIEDAIEVLMYGEHAARDRARLVRTYSNGRVEVDLARRELYSYGRHFPLARYVPGDKRRAPLWVINGDRWRGSRTSRTGAHQVATRDRIARSLVASIVIPFATLDGAGIEIDSIRPIDVRPDAQWEETREADYLTEVPRHARTETYRVTRTAAALEQVPQEYRATWRAITDAEAEALNAESNYARYSGGAFARAPRLPEADGLYRWEEARTRERPRDTDGRYRWTVNVHRLGDALFSAVQPAERSRSARPGESIRVDAETWTEREQCAHNPYAPGDGSGAFHVADETARRCVFCMRDASPITETVRPRAVYLSSFDYNEATPLYFLAKLPRGAGARTVDEALDALAPPAVHAARARGRRVYRQGDIFFIETEATRESLTERGATFARLTQWTREAKPRKGEAGYVAPASKETERRREARERRERARLWREGFRSSVGQLTRSGPRNETARAERCAETAARWHELLTRHAAERAAVHEAETFARLDAPESAPCETCGAAIGEPCTEIAAETVGSLSLALRIEAERERFGAHRNREAIEPRHARELSTLRRETDTSPDGNGHEPGRPSTSRGARRRYAAKRHAASERVDKARADLRRAVFADGTERGARTAYAVRAYGEGNAQYRRRARVELIARARTRYVEAVKAERETWHERGADRDVYRRPFNRRHNATSTAALITWHSAVVSAQVRVRPETVPGAPARLRARALVRRTCSVYGTSHGATETARTRDGAVYARGIARHVPDLEPGRGGERDHADVTLGDGATWFLAVRNTVPRARRNGRRTLAGRR